MNEITVEDHTEIGSHTESDMFYSMQENADDLWDQYVEKHPEFEKLLNNLYESPYVQYAVSHIDALDDPESVRNLIRNTLLMSLTFLGIQKTIALLKVSAYGFTTEGMITYFTLANIGTLDTVSIKFSVLSSLIGGVSDMASPRNPRVKALELVEQLVDDPHLKSTIDRFFRVQIDFPHKTFH
jgi:hypothetical protein